MSDATPISAYEFRETVINIQYLLRINKTPKEPFLPLQDNQT